MKGKGCEAEEGNQNKIGPCRVGMVSPENRIGHAEVFEEPVGTLELLFLMAGN